MKNRITSFVVSLQTVRPYLNLVVTLFALLLLVIGVGAPNDGGSVGPH